MPVKKGKPYAEHHESYKEFIEDTGMPVIGDPAVH
jgi:hypothetical protein